MRVIGTANCVRILTSESFARHQSDVDAALFHAFTRQLNDGQCKSIVVADTNEDSGFKVWQALCKRFATPEADNHLMMINLKESKNKMNKE